MISLPDPRAARRRRFSLLLLLTAAVLVPGCGLSDYEELMREAQEHEHRYDEQSKLLDEPLDVPLKKEKDQEVPVAQFFLRPPKGIAKAYEGDPRDGLLYRYPQRQSNSQFQSVELAFGTDDKFTAEVIRHYQAAGPDAHESNHKVTDPEREAPLVFDRHEFSEGDGSSWVSINICQSGKLRMAVVFRVGKGLQDSARKAMELSLQSLALGPDADRQRAAYNRRTPWGQAAPAPR